MKMTGSRFARSLPHLMGVAAAAAVVREGAELPLRSELSPQPTEEATEVGSLPPNVKRTGKGTSRCRTSSTTTTPKRNPPSGRPGKLDDQRRRRKRLGPSLPLYPSAHRPALRPARSRHRLDRTSHRRPRRRHPGPPEEGREGSLNWYRLYVYRSTSPLLSLFAR